MISTEILIWISIQPLIQTFLTVGAGFALNKAKIFSTEATRGGAQVVLNVGLPCLLFSHIVPAIGTHNINSLAPLATIGVIYGVTGMLMAWTIKSFFWVPHRFRYGILAAGCWGNSGDMPAAVALSITASAPFGGVDDQNLAIAYMSMFIFVFFITLFALRGYLILAKDFEGPDVPSEVLRERMYLRRRRMVTNVTNFLRRLLCLSQHPNAGEKVDFEKNDPVFFNGSTGSDEGFDQNTISWISPTSTIIASSPTSSTIELFKQPTADHSSHRRHHNFLSSLRDFLKELLKPCTVVIVLSFVVSLVDPLKALFIPPSSTFQPDFWPTAPGGQPPLVFIFNTTTFIGGACIPLGLICLGSALAGLSFRSGGPFPKGAIALLTLGKMVVNPIIGIAITRAFIHVGFVNRDDKVLQFVCFILSGIPTSSTLVYLTQIYSPTGNVEHISAFLVPQYILLPFTMIGLVSYALNFLF